MKQTVMHVVYVPTDHRWRVEVDGVPLSGFRSRDQAILEGKTRGLAASASGQGARLIVHSRSGGVEAEYPYDAGSIAP